MNCKIIKEPFKYEVAIKILEKIVSDAETINSVETHINLFSILAETIEADYMAITSNTLPVPSKIFENPTESYDPNRGSKRSSSFEPSSHLTGKQESLEPVLDDGNDFVINYYINVSFCLCS